MKRVVRAVVVSAALAAGLLSVPASASAAGTPYVPGTLRPSVSQATQDQALQKYYDFWKKNFLTTKCGSGTYAVLSKDADHSFVAEGEGTA